MKLLTIVAAAIITTACGQSPTMPTTSTAPTLRQSIMAYDINVPAVNLAATLNAQHPDGVLMSPIEAQAAFDFTETYHGSPNVYFGEVAPPLGVYTSGIVVAPARVAGMRTFRASDWPGPGFDANTVYTWQGTFRFARNF